MENSDTIETTIFFYKIVRVGWSGGLPETNILQALGVCDTFIMTLRVSGIFYLYCCTVRYAYANIKFNM